MRLGSVYDIATTIKIGEEIENQTIEIFSNYLTDLTNLVNKRAEQKEKEIDINPQNYA